MNTNPSPKTRFQSEKRTVEAHNTLMQNPVLQQSIDFALLEYQGHLQRTTPDNVAGAGHLRMVGALEFVHTLKNLGQTVVIESVKVDDNLQHKV